MSAYIGPDKVKVFGTVLEPRPGSHDEALKLIGSHEILVALYNGFDGIPMAEIINTPYDFGEMRPEATLYKAPDFLKYPRR